MPKTTAVAKKGASAIAAYDYSGDEGAGFENQTSDDLAIPFLGVLQALSPQVADPSDGGIANAKAGMLFNTVTEVIFDGKDGVEIIPALTEHVFVEWVPRNRGGGFVARHELTSDVVKEAKEGSKSFGRYSTDYTPTGDDKNPFQGNDLVETFYVYGVLVGEVLEPIVLAFTSTKISVYKRFNTKLNMYTQKQGDRKIRPPLYAHRIRLTTVKQKNADGEFHNFALASAEGDVKSSLLNPDDERFVAAKGCREMVLSGTARASHETERGSDTSESPGKAHF
jgi:hypothetical protein